MLSNQCALPRELARSIVEHVDEKDVTTLLSLMCTSSLWKHEAQRILYRNFTMSTSTNNALARASTYLNHLQKNPCLATHLQCFRFLDYGAPFAGEGDQMTALYNVAESILKKASNLREVYVEDLIGNPEVDRLLLSVVGPVEKLTYETVSADAPMDIERVISAVSTNEQLMGLKHIDLHSRENEDVMLNRSCSPLERCSDEKLRRVMANVSYLGGDGYTIRRLLPFYGPKMSELRWLTTDDFYVTGSILDAFKDLSPGVSLGSNISIWINELPHDWSIS